MIQTVRAPPARSSNFYRYERYNSELPAAGCELVPSVGAQPLNIEDVPTSLFTVFNSYSDFSLLICITIKQMNLLCFSDIVSGLIARRVCVLWVCACV